MNDFLEQCRREWKRLRVPDSLANEMAAELAADLKEAAAEGVSADDLLGNAVTDPRSFAASWADERGVIPLGGSTARLPGRTLILAAIVVLTIITAVGAGLVLLASPPASAPLGRSTLLAALGASAEPGTIVAVDRTEPNTIRVISPSPISRHSSRRVWIASDGRVAVTPIGGSGVEIHPVGSILLTVGIVGVIASLLLLLWSAHPQATFRPGLPK